MRIHNRIIYTLAALAVALTGLVAPRAATAQTDTVFWFAVPHLASGYGQDSVRLSICANGQPATVSVTLPADPSFAPLTATVGAGGAALIDLTALTAQLETHPANTALGRGLRVSSDAPVVCRFECVGPDFESYQLKGRRALGTYFLVPMQTRHGNASGAAASIELVATEDGTEVELTAPVALQGGIGAGTPLHISLDRGQSYAVRAAGNSAAAHLHNTLIHSTKPIAVNATDDQVDLGAGCTDLVGDQLYPMSEAGKFGLFMPNSSDSDWVYIFPVKDSTIVYVRCMDASNTLYSSLDTIISRGEHLAVRLDSIKAMHISEPVACFQTSASGCGAGGAVLAMQNCILTDTVTYRRMGDRELKLAIWTNNDEDIDYFSLNGDPTAITAADFVVSPDFPPHSMCCVKDISSLVEPGGTLVLTNSNSGHLVKATLWEKGSTGGVTLTDFADPQGLSTGVVLIADTSYCSGDSIVFDHVAANVDNLSLKAPDGTVLTTQPFVLHNVTSAMSGWYTLEGSVVDNSNPCVGWALMPATTLMYIHVKEVSILDHTAISICDNGEYTFYGETYTEAGTYYRPSSESQCENLHELQLSVRATSRVDTVATVCDSLRWFDSLYVASGTYLSPVLGSNTAGCDSMQQLTLTVNYSFEGHDSIIFCPGMPITYLGVTYDGPTHFDNLYTSRLGCDSLLHIHLLARDSNYRPQVYYRFDSASWEPADSMLLGCAATQLALTDTSAASAAWLWTVATPDSVATSNGQGVELRFDTPSDRLAAYISLIVTDTLGCLDTLAWPVYAFLRPLADFTWSPDIPAIHNPEVQFRNLSRRQPEEYFWSIQQNPGGGFDTTSERNPRYHWGETGDDMTGEYTVELVAYNHHTAGPVEPDTVTWLDTLLTLPGIYGPTPATCTDTAQKTLIITNDYLQFPNVVTPNGDGVNDTWEIVNLVEYGNYSMNELWIYDRTGARVFHATNISRHDQFWDPAATRSPDGTYFYRFTARGEYGIVKRNGIIEVMRKRDESHEQPQQP